MSRLTASPAWQALAAHQRAMAGVHLRDLFAADPQRFARFSLRHQDILLDYSKNLLTAETLRLLLDLAAAAELPRWIQAMFAGAPINATERRPALHVALRNRADRPILVDGEGVISQPAEKIPFDEIVDSIGAGDSFDAGFVDAWIAKKSKRECLSNATRIAARTLLKPGGQL